MTTTFTIQGDCDSSVRAIFDRHNDRLRFGWDGVSTRPCTYADIFAAPVEFNDYLMEGFVRYTMQVYRIDDGMLLIVNSFASNRDQFIPGHIRFHLQQANVTVSA